MIQYEHIAETCRYLDAQADEGVQIEELARARGIDPHDMVRAAHQRALRMAMLLDDQDPRKVSKTEKTMIHLSTEARRMMPLFQAAFVDGFMAGHATTNPDHKVPRFPERS